VYLTIQTEMGTFAVPLESAVDCIVSEQEITQMLTRVVQIPITGYEASNLEQAVACTSA